MAEAASKAGDKSSPSESSQDVANHGETTSGLIIVGDGEWLAKVVRS